MLFCDVKQFRDFGDFKSRGSFFYLFDNCHCSHLAQSDLASDQDSHSLDTADPNLCQNPPTSGPNLTEFEFGLRFFQRGQEL